MNDLGVELATKHEVKGARYYDHVGGPDLSGAARVRGNRKGCRLLLTLSLNWRLALCQLIWRVRKAERFVRPYFSRCVAPAAVCQNLS